METDSASVAALTIALATAAGIVSQSLARSLNFPGIVVLLGVGVLLGPDMGGVIQPASLGAALPQLVAFAVAVILFEGGMSLKIKQFRRRSTAIRRLITYGAVISLVGGTLAAKLVLGWGWREAALFGSLVVVTGPTVVTPLVRRFKLVPAVGTILEAEGVLIDAIGAVIAVVALEIALEPTGAGVAKGVVGIAARLGFGASAGLVGGFLLYGLLSLRGLVAEGLENVFTLAMVWALYQVSDAVMHESGIAAVTVAGLVVGNMKSRVKQSLKEFKDQLTVMLIGMLFVLLAANVRLEEVKALGVPGLVVVAALVFVVRPVGVMLSTVGCDLSWQRRAFIAWIGPRGIIAAAVASLFASRLDQAGIEGGQQLNAMVFMVIAVTVVLAGSTGGIVAKLLRVSRKPKGWLFLGANGLACELARELMAGGEEVVCLDSSVDNCALASKIGVSVIRGNALEVETLHEAKLELRAGVASLTPNDEVNLLFIEKARQVGKVAQRFAALRSATQGATTEMVHDAGGQVLFADDYDVELWSSRVRSRQVVKERLMASKGALIKHDEQAAELVIPIAFRRKGSVRPVADDLTLKQGDEVTFLLDRNQLDKARSWLAKRGWNAVSKPESLDQGLTLDAEPNANDVPELEPAP